MPVVEKTANKETCGDVVVIDNVKSHANDPFFVKKVADAKRAIRKITLPTNKSK